ncbi:MAG: S41 family peptidase, partial [Pirellulales bacterium]
IQREIIRVDTVMGDQRNEQDRWDFALDRAKGIGYVRVSAFSRETRRELQKALEELQSQKLRGLILDLRGNPGGLLTSAIEIADLFLEEGVIVSTSGRNSAKRSWDARKPGTFTGFPMAVLVNRYSASASEIVSAALQDHKRAVVIGERTWGKGSVQNVIELENGKSALKLTTASYQRPNGHNIHRFPDAKETDEWGVVPDPGFEVKLEDEELMALLRYRRDRDVLLINHSVPADERNGLPKDDAAPQADESSKAKEPQPGAKSDAGDGRDQPGGAESNNDGGKPTGKPAGEDAGQQEASKKPASKPFVDRQLQKAIDYLTTELAKAN